MTISPIDYNSYAIPAQINNNCEDCKEYEKADSNNDGLLTVDEIGAPSALLITNAISQESIETLKIQEDIASVFNLLQQGKIDQQKYNELLKGSGIEINEDTQNPSNKNFEENILNEKNEENQDQLNFTSTLYAVTTNSSEENTKLSSYATMMDLINKETQPANINEKLSLYTQNLRY